MNKTSNWWPVLAAVAIAGASTACGSTPASAEAASTRPSVLRYAYAPSADEPEKQVLRFERLQEYLQDQLGMPVEITRTSGGYGVIIEALRAKKVDIAGIGPFGYLIATQKAGVEAIVVSGSKATGQGAYRGTIVVPADSPIHSIDDLVRHSKTLTFSFVDPASTSGFLVQRAFLETVGLDADSAFKKTMFSMNHMASAMTLVAGKVDAAAISETTMNKLLRNGKVKREDIRVLWTSPWLPTSPIAVRKALPPDLKVAFQRAMVEMPERAPDLWKVWPKSTLVSDPVLLPGDDSMFDGLRAMASQVENLHLHED